MIMCANCQQLVPVRYCMVIVVPWIVRHAAQLVQLCMQRLDCKACHLSLQGINI